MGEFCLFSYSSNTCRQEPQGETGREVNPVLLYAAIANVFIDRSGCCDMAVNNATRSAHMPDGYAAFS